MLNKGISPVVATVILVAVALILSVALAGWVMGLWGTLGATEVIQIVYASLNTSGLNVTIVNRGTALSNILNVSLTNATQILTVTQCSPSLPTPVSPGATMTIMCGISPNADSGKVYTVRVVTSGGVFTYDVRAIG